MLLYAGLIVLCLTYSTNTMSYSGQMIKDFFKTKTITIAHLFTCSNEDALNLSKELILHLGNGETKMAVSSPSLHNPLEWLYPMPYRLGVFADLNCNKTIDTILQLSNNISIFNGSYVWLCWSEHKNTIEFFTEVEIYLDSDITVLIPKRDENTTPVQATLFNVFKAFPERPLNVTMIGLWSLESGIVINLHINRKPNFEGIRLSVSMVLTALEVDMKKLGEQISDKSYHPELDIVNRYFYVLNEILRIMNNYTWEIVMTNSWGYPQEDGHFNGMIGAVENGTAHYAMGPAEPRADRQTVADFLIPLHGFRTCFVFRQPKVLGTYQALASPLNTKVWTYLFVIMLVASVTYKMIYSFRTIYDDENEDSLFWGLLLTIGVIAQQGISINQERLSGRMFCLVLLFLGVMTLAYYNAAIMNSLLSPSPNTIKTIEQLVQSPLQLAMLDIPYLVSRINSENPLAAAAYEKMMKQKPIGIVDSLSTGVATVRGSRYAFYAEDTILYSEIDQTFRDVEKCDLSELEMLRPYPVASSIKKGSPFKESLNRNILLMMERGVLFREDKVWYAQRPTCLGSQDILYVSLEAVSIAFWILSTGFAISSALFTLEIVAGRWYISNNRSKEKNQITTTKSVLFI